MPTINSAEGTDSAHQDGPYSGLPNKLVRAANGIDFAYRDQPSTQFGSFGIPDIAAVGADLNRKLLISAMTSKHGSLQRKPQGRVRIRQV